MAKESGIGMSIAIDDATPTARTVSNDITATNISIPRALQDVTGLDKSAHERLALLSDLQQGFNFVFNDASNAIFDVTKSVASSSPVSRTVTNTVSAQVLAYEGLLDGVAWSRAAGGAMTGSANALLQDGTAPTWST